MRGLILSAGLGERLRPLTALRAKPALEFLNVPMLGFPYFWLNTLGLEGIVFNTHYLAETVRHAAMQIVAPEVPMHFTHEPVILGSGGGIWNARFHLRDGRDFAVANGDGVVITGESDVLARMLDFHRSKDALATLLVCPLEGVGTRIPGVWLAPESGAVKNFGKRQLRTGDICLHYASYMILSPRIWDLLPEGNSNLLYDVLEPAITAGERVFGFRADSLRWFETGNVSDYLCATRTCLELLRAGEACGLVLARLLERHGPPSAACSDFTRLALIADSAEVAPGAVLRGFSVIGPEAKVGAGAELEDCVVLPRAEVGPGQARRHEVLL